MLQLQKEYNIGDRVITTHANTGTIVEKRQDIDISPAYAEARYIGPSGEKHEFALENGFILLEEGVDFGFKNKYAIKFDDTENNRQITFFNPESIRLFNKPFAIAKVQLQNQKVTRFIIDENHKKYPQGFLLAIEFLKP